MFLLFVEKFSFVIIGFIRLLIILINQQISLHIINLVGRVKQYFIEKLYFELNYFEPLIFLIIRLFDSTAINIIVVLTNLVEY